MALSTAWAVLTAPTAAGVTPAQRARWDRYAYLWAWETGTVFGTDGTAVGPSVWSESLKQTLRLYRHTRLGWNPFPDLTDFWGSMIYPGVLTRTGLPAPDGTPSAIPFPDDTPPALVAAAAQIWWWSGMQHLKYVVPHWAAIAGNMLLEVVDDVPGRKILLRPRWAGTVADLELNSAGDVLAVATEYTDADASGRAYVYRQEIDRRAYRTFRDGQLYDYSGDLRLGAVRPNEWGFVPACWVPHQPTGGWAGSPAIGAALQELLEINSLQAMLDDSVGRATKPIFVLATDTDVTPIFANGKRGATSDVDPDGGDRESILAWKISADGHTGKLDPSADTAAIAGYLNARKTEFYRHFPELSMWESLRAMQQVSGVAAEILHGDTRAKATAIRAVTDRQLEKATAMAITMAGVRLNQPGPYRWQTPDARHAVFAPYGLDSFGKGDLDWAIAARPLVPAAPLTAAEEAELADMRLNNLHLPTRYVLEKLGIPAKVITQMETDQAAAQAQAAATQATAAATAAAQPFPDPLQNQVRAAFGQQAKADGTVG